LTKRRAFTDHQGEQYEKAHHCTHPLEEEAKTRRELTDLGKRNQKHRASTRTDLRSLRASDLPVEREIGFVDAEGETARRNLRSNARTHKERLKALCERQPRSRKQPS